MPKITLPDNSVRKFDKPISVNELAEEYDGRIKFTKLDVDSNPATATNFSIRGIPTMLIFKGGQPVESIVGAVPKSTLKKKLDEILI